jgi:hypothetical protein
MHARQAAVPVSQRRGEYDADGSRADSFVLGIAFLHQAGQVRSDPEQSLEPEF